MSKSPEPIILAVALLLLAVGAGVLAYFFPSVQDITGIKTTEPTGQGATALRADQIEARLAIWSKPDLWMEPSPPHRLFDADQYLFYPSAFPAGDYVKKMDVATRSPSGVLLGWYQAHHLDFTDPNVDREDPDGDGFSNLAEFKNEPVGARLDAADCDGTKSADPRSADSHPPYLNRLRLQRFELRPFHIQFTGYQQLNGVYLFQLHLDDVPSYNQPALKKSGDDLGFEGYLIGAFNQNFTDVTDPQTHSTVHQDSSTLELDKPQIGVKVILPFRQIVNSPEFTAHFVVLLPTEVNKVIKVARGKTLVGPAPYLSNESYVVIEADDSGAKIRDVKTNQLYSIPKLIPAEWNEVPVLPAEANAIH